MAIMKKAFENVGLILCDPKHEHQRTLRTALVAEGFRSIKDVSELEVIRDITEKSVPDLIVIDLDMPDGSTGEFVRDVRNGNLGINPFIPIIAVTWDANMDVVKEAVDAGVDDLLAAPISVKAILGRIDILITNRKPFVVTSDYIGPDRRKRGRSEDFSGDVPLFHVPNTLRDKAAGRRVDITELQKAINSVLFEMNEQRLIRHSYQINFLVNLIVKATLEDNITEDVEEHIRRLAEIANECGLRLQGSSFEDVAELCKTLIDVTTNIAENSSAPDPKDIRLLPQLGQAVLVGFNPNRDASDMVNEINEMVKKFAERANADALKKAAARSQQQIDAQRVREEKAKEEAVTEKRKQALKEKMAARRARDEAAILAARQKAEAKRMASQEALPIKVAMSEQPKDMQEWHERRARSKTRYPLKQQQ